MEKIYLLLVLLFSSAIYSQTQGITYQAVILNPEGQNIPGYNNQRAPLANKDICIRFTKLLPYLIEMKIITNNFTHFLIHYLLILSTS